MGALEQVVKMKSQGKSQDEIVNALQNQGVSPKAINDAINQSEVKSAVSDSSTKGMEPSIMGSESSSGTVPRPSKYKPKAIGMDDSQEQQDYYTPNPQGSGQENFPQSYGSQNYLPPQEQYYPQEGYGDYPAYSSGSAGLDTDTMIEIAEQVFSEKIRKFQKQIEEVEKFKALAETKINHNEERLKRIENSIDKLQAAILEKVGSYGRGLESIKKEMTMMQDSFSKTLPELAKHHTQHRTHETHSKKK